MLERRIVWWECLTLLGNFTTWTPPFSDFYALIPKSEGEIMWVEIAETRHERLLEEMILEAHRGLSSKSRLTPEKRAQVLNEMRYDLSQGRLLVALNYTLNLPVVNLPENTFSFITEHAPHASLGRSNSLDVGEYAQVFASLREENVNRYVFTDKHALALNASRVNGLENKANNESALKKAKAALFKNENTSCKAEASAVAYDTFSSDKAHYALTMDGINLDDIAISGSYVAVLNEQIAPKAKPNSLYYSKGLHLLPSAEDLGKYTNNIIPDLVSFSLAPRSYSFNRAYDDNALIFEYGFISDPGNDETLGVSLEEYRAMLLASFPIAFAKTYDLIRILENVPHLSCKGLVDITYCDENYAFKIDHDIFHDNMLYSKVREGMHIQIVQQSDTYHFVYDHKLNTPVPFRGVKEEIMGVCLMSHIDNQFCHLSRVYVRPQFRRLGVATALINKAKIEATNFGYNGILLDTIPTLKGAVKLYESLGFMRVFFAKFLIKSAHESAIYFAYMIAAQNSQQTTAISTAS